MIKKFLILSTILLLSFSMAGAVMWDLHDIMTGKQMVPDDNNGAPWFNDSSKIYFGTGKDVSLGFNATTNALASTVPSDVSGSPNQMVFAQVQTIGTTSKAPEASDDDQLFAAVPANNTTHILVRSSGVGSSSFLAQPDFPRNIIVTPSGSATGSLKITGTDISGAAITSNLTFTTTGAVSGLAAFATVTRIDGTFTQAAARTLKIGTGDVLGLNQKLATNTVQMAALNAVREATAPTVTVSSATLSLNTIDLQSSYATTSPIKIWFFK